MVTARSASPPGVVLPEGMAIGTARLRDGEKGSVQRTHSLSLGLRLAGRGELAEADTDSDGHRDCDERPEDQWGHKGRSATGTTKKVHP
jgi:hypothetical protein